LVLLNHFFSFYGFETTNVEGDSHTGAPIIPTVVVEFNYENITVKN